MGEAAKGPAGGFQKEWFTTSEAAEYCAMQREALLKHVQRGSITPDSPARPGFRVHRFRRTTLDCWLLGGSHVGQG